MIHNPPFPVDSKERVYWFVDSEEDKPYGTSTYYRCVGLAAFLDRVEKDHKIVALTVEGNNIGFILDDKSNV